MVAPGFTTDDRRPEEQSGAPSTGRVPACSCAGLLACLLLLYACFPGRVSAQAWGMPLRLSGVSEGSMVWVGFAGGESDSAGGFALRYSHGAGGDGYLVTATSQVTAGGKSIQSIGVAICGMRTGAADDCSTGTGFAPRSYPYAIGLGIARLDGVETDGRGRTEVIAQVGAGASSRDAAGNVEGWNMWMGPRFDATLRQFDDGRMLLLGRVGFAMGVEYVWDSGLGVSAEVDLGDSAGRAGGSAGLGLTYTFGD
jgi:hypothetical protein